MNPIFTMLIEPITGLLDKVVPDLDERKRLAHEIATMAERHGQAQIMAQIEVNKQEAQHRSLFVAGWRPFIGWTCGLGLFYNVIGHPVLDIWFTMPTLDPELLYPVMLGMLGLGGANVAARSWEKGKGLTK